MAKSIGDIAALLSAQKALIEAKAAKSEESPAPAAPLRAGSLSVTPEPSVSPGLKRKRDDFDVSMCDSEENGLSNSPDTKAAGSVHPGSGHIQEPGEDRRFYRRKEVPQHTTTYNAYSLPHDIKPCRKITAFKKLNEIAEGTFGKVWRAKDNVTGEVYALKQVKMEKEKDGFPLTALREIDVLINLNHPNVVAIKEIVVGTDKESVYVAMEYVEHDIRLLMDGLKYKWTLPQIKCLSQQLLTAVDYIHHNWVIHRDLKTSNLLYTNKGVLKICDFGLARLVGQQSVLTPGTCTLWYRSPEVLLDARDYTVASDMWAVGCIIAEFFLGNAFLQGKDEVNQLNLMFGVLGVPTEATWPDFYRLPKMKTGLSFTGPSASRLAMLFSPTPDHSSKPYVPSSCLSLMSSLLTFDPKQRATAATALQSPFFQESPRPQQVDMMPTFPATNDKPRKKLKAELREKEKERQAGEK
eukprot:TRINITY_DN23869_c0_g1_i1.p1 TRINITY_DN23869_c0_g1~~TRINITY_DN23869_c0_g1_i1.p1  ORF type:complete len:467 (+),score=79.72 TRINITY_DN23869_c0_g1_i1:74-1474(+)